MKKLIALLTLALAISTSGVNVWAQESKSLWIDTYTTKVNNNKMSVKVESNGEISDGLIVLEFDTKVLSISDKDVTLNNEVALYSVNVDGNKVKVSFLGEKAITKGTLVSFNFTLKNGVSEAQAKSALKVLSGTNYQEDGKVVASDQVGIIDTKPADKPSDDKKDDKPSGGDTSKDDKPSGGDTSKDDKPSSGDTSKDDKPSGGNTSKDDKPSSGNTSNGSASNGSTSNGNDASDDTKQDDVTNDVEDDNTNDVNDDVTNDDQVSDDTQDDVNDKDDVKDEGKVDSETNYILPIAIILVVVAAIVAIIVGRKKKGE